MFANGLDGEEMRPMRYRLIVAFPLKCLSDPAIQPHRAASLCYEQRANGNKEGA
jgi:hypothetical protein